MTRETHDRCPTPADSNPAEHGGPARVETSIEAPALEHAESVPTPPPTPSGCRTIDSDGVELDVSSPKLRLFKGRLYIALPNIRPPCLKEEETTRIIKRLEIDLEFAAGKIRSKSHRKHSRESTWMIDMRMSGELERGSTKVKLKPCIWIFCGSRWCRKIIEKDIKKLNWRLPCGLKIVDEGGPFAFLAASEEGSSVDDSEGQEPYLTDHRNDTSHCATSFDTPNSLEDPNYHDSRNETEYSRHPGFDCHRRSMTSAHSPAGPGQRSKYNSKANVYNTIHRQERETSPFLLPCEFSMTGCDRVFHRDEDNEWIAHIIGHLRDIIPRKLRCWYCVKHTFDADITSDGNIRINFRIRMQHIRQHILFDEKPVSWARLDMSVVKHLLLHKFIDDKTFHRLSTGCLAIHNGDESLRLSDDMFLDFHVQESDADSSIGLTCRSTTRRHSSIISTRFSRMGGVISITRGSETTYYGVTSGHGLVCQILEDTSISTDGSNDLSDESSTSSFYDGDSGSDRESQENSNQIHYPSPTGSQEKVENWMTANDGLVASFSNLRADSVDCRMISREADSIGDNKISGDLALIKIPTSTAKVLPNDFVDPTATGPKGHTARGEGHRCPASTETSDDDNKVFVLLGKSKSVAGCVVAGTVHFSVRGRKIECARIMLSEELGLGSSGSWVVQDDVLYGMVIALTPMDGCALILPQRRMYADIQGLFPDATSILLSSGVPDAVRRRGLQKAPVEQVNLKPQLRAGRGIRERKDKVKEKEPCYFEPWQRVPGLSRHGKTAILVEITTNSSGTRRRRHPQSRYYP
ncbi:hypothetical protein KVR01_005814 [Diaporthe batatas]|uniref:uncharacterized protein n=1 Tax=Diaporthe batatas TaxID=748121 RepID=UPI001D03897B|nr:uncharacterized protein KVR01_005814 [Diaporthe batatas]KAG8163896.1 hypothetical protein KVR01_005814 [Diaporthe batatas]